MTKPLEGKTFFEFRDRIMGMSKSETLPKGKKCEMRSHIERIWSLAEQSEDSN